MFNLFKQPFYEEDDGVNFGGDTGETDAQVADVQEEVQEEVEKDDSDSEKPQEESEENSHVADVKPERDLEKDRIAANARRESEQQARVMKARQDNFAKQYGYDSFEEMELSEQARKLSEQNPNYSQEAAVELIQLRREKAEALVNRTLSLREQQREKLKNEPLFDEIDKLAQETLKRLPPNNDYETVFTYISGRPEFKKKYQEILEKKVSEERKNTEKRTIANIHDKKSRGLTGSSDGDPSETVALTKDGELMTKAFGNDPKEIASYVKKQTRR